jgi:hypothetical protein
MLRTLSIVFTAAILTSCASSHSERYALAQNPTIELRTTSGRGAQGRVFIQEYQGIASMVGMDRDGNLRRHVLVTAGENHTSLRDGSVLRIPNGTVPVPDSLYHLSGIPAYPLLIQKLKSLAEGSTARITASSAPSGDLVDVEWICTKRTARQRHYIARYEVTTAELRYAKIRGRWTLESAEYSEREYVQRWNRIPRR